VTKVSKDVLKAVSMETLTILEHVRMFQSEPFAKFSDNIQGMAQTLHYLTAAMLGVPKDALAVRASFKVFHDVAVDFLTSHPIHISADYESMRGYAALLGVAVDAWIQEQLV
jgi:hypothetical protein